MNIHKWFSRRGSVYVGQRAVHLVRRYGFRSTRATARAEELMRLLQGLGCAPTLPTPGSVVDRYPSVVRRLEAAGAEIAVHSYDHVDLAAYPVTSACQQLTRAAAAFRRHGLAVHGFRCPYLSCPEPLLESLPEGVFAYSSNRAVVWEVGDADEPAGSRTMYSTLGEFYSAKPASELVSVPWKNERLIEIPVSVPDDLQLHDGLGLDAQGIARAWQHILDQTYRRGELFVLLFHPELYEHCHTGFVEVLTEAKRRQPSVWIARLCDIADWWTEKASFSVSVSPMSQRETLRLAFACSDRATILARGMALEVETRPWDGSYRRLVRSVVDLPGRPRPFVGVADQAPPEVVRFLKEHGYLVETGNTAQACALYLDEATLGRLTNQVALIEHIEAHPGPLIRYWRWPDGARSALCVSGDLDALSLRDYAFRLFAR